jgi:leader peptidase (prepilin peptidase) / N-methyltransferase
VLLFWCVCALFALLLGSFLNVVILRLPVCLHRLWTQQSLLFLEKEPPPSSPPFNLFIPRSQCPSCQHTIPFYDNIPVFSFFFLKARCRFCSTAISWRYPLIEILTCLSSLAIIALLWPTCSLSYILLALALNAVLICLTVIDLEHQILPDEITQPFLWIVLLFPLWDPQHFPSLSDRLLGAAGGYMLLASTAFCFKILTHKEGMGQGDFKLLALLGAFFGASLLPQLLLFASLSGCLAAFVLIMSKKTRFDHAIPFGPYLALSGWITLFFGNVLCSLWA